MNNYKKFLVTFALITSLCLSFITPAFAAIMDSDYEYKSVPYTTNQVTGTLLLHKGDSSPYPISVYGQTYIKGFYEGTAPVDTLTVSVTACLNGTCSPKKSLTTYSGQNSPTVTVGLGNNEGSVIYSGTGNHSAKRSGLIYNTPNSYVEW